MTARQDFQRCFMIHVCKDGTVTYRNADKREPVFNGIALPVFSVDTEQQARELQVRFCRCMYDEHPLMPGKPWYVLSTLGSSTHFGTFEVDDLEKVTQMFREFWNQHLNKESV